MIAYLELPLAGERLSEIVVFGNGKDADVMIELLDGRQFVLAVGGGVRVRACQGMEIDLTSWDDLSLIIRYRGEGLTIAAARVEIPR